VSDVDVEALAAAVGLPLPPEGAAGVAELLDALTRDDGGGVAPADAERIFEPGVSGTGGAGLGLPLARRLARAAGGDVLVVDGHFELRLPA
jgi:nitrogen-specific signal transduction histidine kinase